MISVFITIAGIVFWSIALVIRLKQNKLALAVGITNNDSKIEVENTVDTMGSYEGLARTLKKCVVLAPFHNNNSADFADVNTLVANLVMLLAVLSSRQNHGLDSAAAESKLERLHGAIIRPALWVLHDRLSNVFAMQTDISGYGCPAAMPPAHCHMRLLGLWLSDDS